MTTHAREPHQGHQMLMGEMQGVLMRYGMQGIGLTEQIALLAQLIGGKISDLDPAHYSVGEVLQSVSLNIAAGNAAKGTLEATVVPG